MYVKSGVFARYKVLIKMAGHRLFHCDEQALRVNLTANRTEIQHSPPEEGACVYIQAAVCAWVCTNVFVE